MQIPRSFAIATHEVTVAQFRRFLDAHPEVKARHAYPDAPSRMEEVMRRFSPDSDGPQVAVTWYEAAMFCNWLSDSTGIPRSEWVYPPLRCRTSGAGCACPPTTCVAPATACPPRPSGNTRGRGGTTTVRFFGESATRLGALCAVQPEPAAAERGSPWTPVTRIDLAGGPSQAKPFRTVRRLRQRVGVDPEPRAPLSRCQGFTSTSRTTCLLWRIRPRGCGVAAAFRTGRR